MQKALLSGLILLALSVAFTAPTNPLLGRWQLKFSNGDVLLANFRPDGSFDGFVNGKAFANGKYAVKQDVFIISDGQCNLNYFGSYTLRFSSGTDSVHFTVVQDTCRGRRRTIDGYTLGRVKSARQ
jgi:hypothetical protein